MSNSDHLRRGEPHEEAVERVEHPVITLALNTATREQLVEIVRAQQSQLEALREAMAWESVDAVIAERDSLREQLEAARRDAERYRWLLDRVDYGYTHPEASMVSIGGVDYDKPEAIDAAIDAAMASAGGKA